MKCTYPLTGLRFCLLLRLTARIIHDLTFCVTMSGFNINSDCAPHSLEAYQFLFSSFPFLTEEFLSFIFILDDSLVSFFSIYLMGLVDLVSIQYMLSLIHI